MTDGKAIPLTSARDYESTLNSAYVIANFDTRKTLIAQQLQTAASDLSGSLTQDEALLDEVTALCEWPEVLSGQFDTKFLDVPEEALISAMREHQRYFHLRDQQGRLQANFLTVANLISRDPQIVIAGNERVIRPRLTDAQFFYQKDLQRPPLEAQAQLGAVVFQQALGSYADKSNRTIKLAAFIAENLGTNIATAKRAAELAKTDLVSFMVGEFPELQGIMGRYYALAQGESAEVAEAIRDHYLPRFSGDTLPTSATSQGRWRWLTGLIPWLAYSVSDSHQPVAKILLPCVDKPSPSSVFVLKQTFRLSLDALINEAAEPFSHFDKREVKEYILDRFENFMTDQGAQWDSVRAVRARAFGIDDLFHAASDIKTLDQFRLTPASGVVIATQKRVQNIIAKSDNVTRRSVQPEQFVEPAESALWEWICTLDGAQDSSLTTRLARINEGAAMLARYFEDVMVNVDTIELKENRLNTLRHLNQSLTNIAAFNLLQGAET
jgi:glycyl-tRNA synthetase beta chain